MRDNLAVVAERVKRRRAASATASCVRLQSAAFERAFTGLRADHCAAARAGDSILQRPRAWPVSFLTDLSSEKVGARPVPDKRQNDGAELYLPVSLAAGASWLVAPGFAFALVEALSLVAIVVFGGLGPAQTRLTTLQGSTPVDGTFSRRHGKLADIGCSFG